MSVTNFCSPLRLHVGSYLLVTKFSTQKFTRQDPHHRRTLEQHLRLMDRTVVWMT